MLTSLSDLARFAAMFHPEPPTLTPALARWALSIRERYNSRVSRGGPTLDERIELRGYLANHPTLPGIALRGIAPDYARCAACKHWFNAEAPDDEQIQECGECGECCHDNGHHDCSSCDGHSESSCSHCDKCDSCCSCEHCERCNEAVDSTCGGCNRCERCCEGCHRCSNCDAYTDDYCSECDWCCDCGHGSGCNEDEDDGDNESVNYTKRGQVWRAPGRQKVFDCTRAVGVEVEYNTCNSFDAIDSWARAWNASVHSDGSCGWEAVSSPAAGDRLVGQLRGLCEALDDAGAKHNDSCGIHVHVDARDLRWADMLRLCAVYARVEPLLYLIGGQKRINNQYCAPIGSRFIAALASSDPKDRILAFALKSNGRTSLRRAPDKKANGRYTGLNIIPWIAGRHKQPIKLDTTVEFRLHREFTNEARLLGWAKLCARIVDWSAKATDADVDRLPRSAARALSEVIAPDLADWILARLKEYRTACRSYARRIGYQPRLGYTIDKKPQVRTQAQEKELACAV